MSDELIEQLIEDAEGARWVDGEFRIDSQGLTKMLRAALAKREATSQDDARDAERYRMARHMAMADYDCQCPSCVAAEAYPKVSTDDEFDAAIDAVILAAKKEG